MKHVSLISGKDVELSVDGWKSFGDWVVDLKMHIKPAGFVSLSFEMIHMPVQHEIEKTMRRLDGSTVRLVVGDALKLENPWRISNKYKIKHEGSIHIVEFEAVLVDMGS